MDSDSLKAFIAVAETASFSSAAKKLFITQPAVSKRIAALEQHLDHALFDRLARDVTLTDAGQKLLPQARAILQSISDTERSIRELSGEIAGSLRVATSHHIGLHHLPPILRTFATKHRNVNLQFEFLDSEKAHEKLIKGECELAIVTISPQLEEPLTAEVIWHDQLVFVCGKDHELSSRKNVSLTDLSVSAAILPGLNTFTGKTVKRRFEQADLSLSLNMTTNYLETIKMMVSVGLGWSVLPKSMLDPQLIELRIHENKKPVNLSRQLGVVTHKKRTLGNAARAFYAILRDNSTAIT